jgi:hypothetical protein
MVSWYVLDHVTTWFSVFVTNSRMDSFYILVEELFHWESVLFLKNYKERHLWILFSKTVGRTQSFWEKRLRISHTISVFQGNPETDIHSFQWKMSEPTRKKYGYFRKKIENHSNQFLSYKQNAVLSILEHNLLRCNTAYFDRSSQMFPGNVMLPSSKLKIKPSKKPASAGCRLLAFLLAYYYPWRWRQNIPPKNLWTFTKLYGVTS